MTTTVQSSNKFLLFMFLINFLVSGIGFVPSVYAVSEEEGSIIFFIQNVNSNLEREVVVEFTTLPGGTATGMS